MAWTVDARPIVLARGVFSPAAGSGEQGPPGSGATVTLIDTTANGGSWGRIKRIRFSIFSSHVSAANGVTIDGTDDRGTNWDNIAQSTLAATTPTIITQNMNAYPDFRVRYVNSANNLTAWRFAIIGEAYDQAA